MPQEQRPRVLLADDHARIVEAFQGLLEPFCEVIGSVNDGHALLDAVTRLKPDVVVIDISMPGVTGLDACCQIKQAAPRTKVVIATAAQEEAIRQKAFSVGASAFVVKYLAAQELLSAIQGALREDG